MVLQTYASLARRIVAFLIDCVLIGFIGTLAAHIVPILGPMLVWFSYGPVFESSEIRATIGKHLMGIQVADLTGRRLSFKAALLRNALKVVSTAVLFIGFIFALFGGRKQTLHDMLADSVVVYGRSDTPIVDAWLEQSKEILRMGKTAANSFEAPRSKESVASQLERLQALFNQGSLTPSEFEAAKKKVLND